MKLRLWNIFILGLLLTSNMIPAFAEDSDTRELETFFDNFMAEKLPDLNIPGASLIVVQDGEIVLSKGYGFADIDSETPVNPAETIFRVRYHPVSHCLSDSSYIRGTCYSTSLANPFIGF